MSSSTPEALASFQCEYRVYYEDTDAAGVVYYANYLKFAERARTEWLRSLGFSQEDMLRNEGIGFVVTRANIAYKRPARLDDILNIETHLQQIGKVRMSMRQTLRVQGTVCAVVEVEVACVNKGFAPTALPASLARAFGAADA